MDVPFRNFKDNADQISCVNLSRSYSLRASQVPQLKVVSVGQKK